MNEILFIAHIIFVFIAAVGAFLNGPFVTQTVASLYVVFANLFVIKKMLLGGVLVSGCDAYLIGSICALLMGRELWGERFALDLSIISMAVSGMFLVLCWFQVAYVPIATDIVHDSFAATIGLMPFITVCSLGAHLIAQLVTLLVSRVLSAFFEERYITGVAFLAMFVGQIVDSILFFGGAFFHDVTIAQLSSMVLVSAGLKIGLIAFSSVLVGFAAWCRRQGYVY